jgi:hypothetical protein
MHHCCPCVLLMHTGTWIGAGRRCTAGTVYSMCTAGTVYSMCQQPPGLAAALQQPGDCASAATLPTMTYVSAPPQDDTHALPTMHACSWTNDGTELPVPSNPRLASPYSHWGTAKPVGTASGVLALKSLRYTSIGASNARVAGNRDAWGWSDSAFSTSAAYICIRQCEYCSGSSSSSRLRRSCVQYRCQQGA